MSGCEKFQDIAQRSVDNNASDEELSLLHEHLKNCSSCAEDLAFNLSIKNTLRSLPKIEVSDNFLMSLNEKLDFEDKIKKEAVAIRKKSFYGTWKKYSALTACLVLAVLLKIDVWNVTDIPENNHETLQQLEEIIVSEQISEPEERVIATLVEEQTETQVVEILEVKKETPKKVTEVKKSPEKQNTVAPAKTEAQPIMTEEEPQNEEKIYIVKAETPHSMVEMPGYMDNKDNIVVIDPPKRERVKFDDYEMIVTDELLEAFSLAEMPSNGVIVATPNAVSSVSNISITASTEVPVISNDAGSGSLVVSQNDREKVEKILSKYFSGKENQVFMLSSENYNSFIGELKNNGIEFHDYMIYTQKTNVAFELITS